MNRYNFGSHPVSRQGTRGQNRRDKGKEINSVATIIFYYNLHHDRFINSFHISYKCEKLSVLGSSKMQGYILDNNISYSVGNTHEAVNC